MTHGYAEELLADLQLRGVHFDLNDGHLSVRAPAGTITSELAAQIREHKAELMSLLTAKCSHVSEHLPLTATQERMWSHGALHPDLPIYVIPAAWDLSGTLDIDRFLIAYKEVAESNDVFSLRLLEDSEHVIQTYGHAIELPEIYDLTTESIDNKLASIEEKICYHPINLLTDGPVRAALVQLSPDKHRLYMGIHHVAWDGGSYPLFLKALADAYSGGVLEKESSFATYAEVSQTTSEEDAWWKDQLKDPPPPLELPIDKIRPALFDHHSGSVEVSLTTEVHRRLLQTAKEMRVTPFAIYMAGLAGFLARLDRRDDRLIGVVSDERSDEHQSTIGCFVNTLLLRDRTEIQSSFKDSVTKIASTLREQLTYSVPLSGVISSIGLGGDASRPAGGQIIISHQYIGVESAALDDVKVRRIDLPARTTTAELTLNILEDDQNSLVELQYASSLFSHGQADSLAKAFAAFLSSALDNPEHKICELSMMSPDSDAIYTKLNDTKRDLPSITTLDQVEQIAQSTPDQTAIIYQNRQYSYKELLERSSAIAHGLLAEGVMRGDVVGISLVKSPDLICSVLACWMVGAAYLPLDPEHPPSRLDYMKQNAGTHLVIGCALSEADPDVLACQQVEMPLSPAGPEDLAYIIYTSGSTGNPKGVLNAHRQVWNFLDSMSDCPGCSREDRLLAVTTLSFDISILELFLPLITGGCLVIADQEEAVDGERLQDLIKSHHISMMQGTPATWRMLMDSGWQGASDLTALSGGEALTQELAGTLLPKVKKLWNMYGPTETTVWSTCAQITTDTDITIGKPIQNTQIYIASPEGQLCPPGVPGELWIGGEGVALGYKGLEALTNDRFIPNPFREGTKAKIYRTGDLVRLTSEGQLIHLGRIDSQIKVRGFRIEPGEIETALLLHEDVSQAVCVVRQDASGEPSLIAYFTVDGEFAPTGSELRRWLKGRVPAYMVPQLFVEIEKMPLTPNGKIDRKNLPSPGAEQAVQKEYIPPSTEYEKALAQIWTEMLSVDQISTSDNFFELGGQSLQAARASTQFRARTGARIQPRAFIFETLAQLSAGAVAEA